MADFQRFLKGLASVGRENQKFGIVLGNESGDLDSVASTLVLAKTLTEANPVPYLPVMNFRREDLSLRTESLFCLQELLRLDPETLQLLPFLDDPNRWSAESLDEKLSEVILVDHNVINTPEMKFLECKVSKIFDHRAMERAGPAQEGVQIKNETVGSCATLIAEYIFSKECKNKDLDSLRLLRWAILIDTVNLSEQHKKATPKDKDMLEKIEIALGLDHDDEVRNDRKTLHQKISQAKSDTSKFTGYQKLRKDLKILYFENFTVAMSTIPGQACLDLLADSTFSGDLDRFMSKGPYDMAIALGTGDMILRERPGVASDMSKALSAKLVSLDLVRDCSDEINRGEGDVVYLKRLKLEYTRKKLLPIVKDTINEELFKN